MHAFCFFLLPQCFSKLLRVSICCFLLNVQRPSCILCDTQSYSHTAKLRGCIRNITEVRNIPMMSEFRSGIQRMVWWCIWFGNEARFLLPVVYTYYHCRVISSKFLLRHRVGFIILDRDLRLPAHLCNSHQYYISTSSWKSPLYNLQKRDRDSVCFN